MRFSTSRRSRPPPSLLIAPPSNCARISSRFRGCNPKANWLHSVVIRLFSFLAGFLSEQKSYAMKQQPFSIYCEKFRLDSFFAQIAGSKLADPSSRLLLDLRHSCDRNRHLSLVVHLPPAPTNRWKHFSSRSSARRHRRT